jgi:hypothetical protein
MPTGISKTPEKRPGIPHRPSVEGLLEKAQNPIEFHNLLIKHGTRLITEEPEAFKKLIRQSPETVVNTCGSKLTPEHIDYLILKHAGIAIRVLGRTLSKLKLLRAMRQEPEMALFHALDRLTDKQILAIIAKSEKDGFLGELFNRDPQPVDLILKLHELSKKYPEQVPEPCKKWVIRQIAEGL